MHRCTFPLLTLTNAVSFSVCTKKCVYYDPDFITSEQAAAHYDILWKQTPWKTTSKINRWVCLMHDDTNVSDPLANAPATATAASSYQYRDSPDGKSLPFSPTVATLQHAASDWYYTHTHRRVHFNVCLLNFYENGSQRIGWHFDREELGRTTPIASLSLGAARTMMLRSKTNGVQDRARLVLQSGSIVLMENACQVNYLHAVPKESGDMTEGRINLTFRCKTETTAGEVEHTQRDHWLDRLVAETTAAGGNDDEGDNSSKRKTAPQHWSLHAQVGGGDNTGTMVFGDNVPWGNDTIAATPTSSISSLVFLVQTNLGAERYCGAEILELVTEASLVVACPFGWDGVVGIFSNNQSENEDARPIQEKQLLQLRSALHVVKFHEQFDLNELCRHEDGKDELVKAIPAVRMYEYFKQELVDGRASIPTLAEAKTFRVTCERIGGPHAFHSTQVEL